jgi:D-alanyl-D-alanine carboxypeptidase
MQFLTSLRHGGVVLCLIAATVLGCATDAFAAQRKSNSRKAPASYCSASDKCAWLAIDAQSGAVLSSSAPDKIVHPASLTKLMTLYMAFEALEQGRANLGDRINFTAHATGQSPTKLGIQAGRSISYEDAIEAIAIKSANDAAAAMAEHLGGSEYGFARMMTRKALELGMSRTNFQNASGLPNSAQVTTARDMVTLARRILSDFPRYRHYMGMKQAYVGSTRIEGHNRLLTKGECEGGKTGYINASGFNLVAWSTRGGRLIISAVFGGDSAASRDRKMTQIFALAGKPSDKPASPSTQLQAKLDAPPVDIRRPSRKPGSLESLIEEGPETLAELQSPEQTTTNSAALEAMILLDDSQINAVAASAPTFSQSWGIQVGAYKDQMQAQRALAEATRLAPTILGPAFPRTLATDSSMGQLYRAQMIGLDQAAAQQACNRLTRSGMQCLMVEPERN